MKQNYDALMASEIQKIKDEFEGEKPALLLHSCCGPCSTVCLERLIEVFDITVFFYNPNIDPKEEFERRLEALKIFLEKNPDMKNVKLVVPQNQREDFLSAVNLKDFPERATEAECGSRCLECYRFRLEKTASFAQQNGFDFWTTTLTVGPQKDAQKINAVAERIGSEIAGNARYLHADFKKNGGYLRSIELCREYGIYRQNYCGCIFGRIVQTAQNSRNVQNAQN